MPYSTIDPVDRKIIAILQSEGRITNARLSERVHLSQSACLARHRRLEDMGVISGYRAEIAVERVRPVIRALLQIKLRRHLPEDFKLLENLMRDDVRVTEAAEISGEMDYFAMVCVRDITELRTIIEELTIAAPLIECVKSFVVMHRTKASAGPVFD